MFLVSRDLFSCGMQVGVLRLTSELRSGAEATPAVAKSVPATSPGEASKATDEPGPVLAEQSSKPGSPGPTPETKQTSPNTLTILASALVQMKNRGANPAEMQPIVDAMAQLLASSSGACVALPSPTSPASPPEKKTPESKRDASEATVPAAGSTAVPAAASAAGPHVKVEAPSPKPLAPVDHRCNSQSHASEYKAFNRFCESNPNASEMRRAFE